jgi:hypothetical protein
MIFARESLTSPVNFGVVAPGNVGFVNFAEGHIFASP